MLGERIHIEKGREKVIQLHMERGNSQNSTYGTPMLTPHTSEPSVPVEHADSRRITIEKEYEEEMMNFVRELQQQTSENYSSQPSGYESGNDSEVHDQQATEATDETDVAILLPKDPVENDLDESLDSQHVPNTISSCVEEHSSPSENLVAAESVCMSTVNTPLSPLISRQSLCVPYLNESQSNDSKINTFSEVFTLKETLIVDYPETKKNIGHIMISYNHSTKTICSKIAEALRNLNYQVWIDQDNISGDILTSMASGVENAFVVLMAINEKYFQSRYCRLEAEYAMEQNKPLIPMLMQSGYKAFGWLGLINGSKLQIDFSGLVFDQAFQILVREIEAIQISLGGEKKDRTSISNYHNFTTTIENGWTSYRDVNEWDHENLIDWLNQEKLAIFQPALTNFTGATLWQLYKIRFDSPVDYYRTIETLLPLDIPLRLFYNLTFNGALESLFSSSVSKKY